jgi:hypothetical protein
MPVGVLRGLGDRTAVDQRLQVVLEPEVLLAWADEQVLRQSG